MPNIDLTTLPGWSSLSTGSHSITIVAKAENYRDSEPSAAVSVTKGAALISFTIAGTSYQAEEGMTWEQWVNSSYNTGDYTILNDMIYSASNGNFIWYGSNHELATNIIIADREYYRQSGGSAN